MSDIFFLFLNNAYKSCAVVHAFCLSHSLYRPPFKRPNAHGEGAGLFPLTHTEAAPPTKYGI